MASVRPDRTMVTKVNAFIVDECFCVSCSRGEVAELIESVFSIQKRDWQDERVTLEVFGRK